MFEHFEMYPRLAMELTTHHLPSMSYLTIESNVTADVPIGSEVRGSIATSLFQMRSDKLEGA